MTSVHFNTNPVAPIGASVETLVGPGTTKVISIPSATTVILLGSPVPSTTISRSTNVLSGSRTVIHTVSSTTTHVVGVTLGPGGEVVGSVPASVSQPGFVPPVFSVFYPAKAIHSSDFHLQIDIYWDSRILHDGPCPTSSSSTILIGAIFGGGSIVLGAGGTIIGTLPAGIGEVGGVYPVLIPPPQDDPPHQPTLSTSTPSPSASSSKCPRPTVITCGSVCDSDNPDQYFYASDADEDDEAPARRWTSLVQIAGCIDNSKLGLTYPKLGSSADGADQFEKSGGHQRFDFTSYTGNSFDVTQSVVAGKKPRNMGYISLLISTTPPLLQKPKQSLTASIPSQIWVIVLSCVADAQTVGDDSIRTHSVSAKSDIYARWGDSAARAKLEFTMRGFGAVPQSFNPPMAVQFYDFYVSEMSDYTGRGKHLGTYLAERSAGKVVFRPPNTPNHPGMELNSGMTITDATASGTNVQVNLHVQAPNSQGWNYTPTELTDTSCQGVYLMEAEAPVSGSPLWDFDCMTRQLSVSGKTLSFCGVTPPPNPPTSPFRIEYYCATSLGQLQACMVQKGLGGSCWRLRLAGSRRPRSTTPKKYSQFTGHANPVGIER
ncbi:hypothetical protein B0H10DRAFT_2354364 [Mycena sp. CBHHK59/15]|nr:hypothetical protein B0H10DRAFT_2354364 [Mycena sp. CBHHK59/15]